MDYLVINFSLYIVGSIIYFHIYVYIYIHNYYPLFTSIYMYIYTYIIIIHYLLPYIYIYVYICCSFITQCVKPRAILCPHQPPTRVITQFQLPKTARATETVLQSIIYFHIYIYIYTKLLCCSVCQHLSTFIIYLQIYRSTFASCSIDNLSGCVTTLWCG